MTVQRGFYRHYKGHLYFVHGVGADPHDGWKRKVVYTSVKTEEIGEPGQERYDFLLRDEAEFEGTVAVPYPPPTRGSRIVPRFERVTDPERSKVP